MEVEHTSIIIGNGWYVNICSGTGTKYNQISDQLGLELKVELV